MKEYFTFAECDVLNQRHADLDNLVKKLLFLVKADERVDFEDFTRCFELAVVEWLPKDFAAELRSVCNGKERPRGAFVSDDDANTWVAWLARTIKNVVSVPMTVLSGGSLTDCHRFPYGPTRS